MVHRRQNYLGPAILTGAMTGGITYPTLGLNDIDLMLDLMHGLQQDDPWSVPFREAEVRKSLCELLVTPSAGRAFLIRHDQLPIGYLVLSFGFSLEYGGKNAWIDELFIRPDFRGKGIGSQALDFAAQTARELGAKVLHLEVNRGNPAIDLYRRNGFKDHDRFLLSKSLMATNS